MLAILDHHPSIYGIDYESNIFLNARPLAPPLRIIKSFQKWGRSCLEANKKRWAKKNQGIFYIFLKSFFVIQTAGLFLCLEMGET